MKPTLCTKPGLIEGFQMVPTVWPKTLWFGRSQHDKQNKQTTFLHGDIPPKFYLGQFGHFEVLFSYILCCELCFPELGFDH
jgi:hypothetical protein